MPIQTFATPPLLKTMVLPGGTEIGCFFHELRLHAPSVFLLGDSIQGMATTPHNYRLGQLLSEKAGYNVYTVDMIAHGKDRRREETGGEITAIIDRLISGEQIGNAFSRTMAGVLDDLTAARYRDADGMVVVAGISRGGWLAGHWAAREPRIRKVVEVAPVVDFGLLREASDRQDAPELQAVSQMTLVKTLAGTDMWIGIGCHDERVGTEASIAFARALVAAAIVEGGSPKVEMTIFPSLNHFVPLYAHDLAAAWVLGEHDPADV